MDTNALVQMALNVIKNAQAAVKTAVDTVNEVKITAGTITRANEEELEQEITKLEALLPELRQKTQEKLRG